MYVKQDICVRLNEVHHKIIGFETKLNQFVVTVRKQREIKEKTKVRLLIVLDAVKLIFCTFLRAKLWLKPCKSDFLHSITFSFREMSPGL